MGKRDDLMLNVDELACAVNNIKKAVQYYFSSSRNVYKKNKQLLLNGDQSDVCFILGNGPSLKKIDFNDIKEYPCFTVNMFYRGTDEYFSKYHLFLDTGFVQEEYISYVKDIYESDSDINLVVHEKIYDKLLRDGIDCENIYAISPSYVQRGAKIKYDMTKCMTGSLNVIPVAIECAMYMGYKKIYLLGCDFNSYASAKDIHYYEQKEEENPIPRGHEIGDLIRCSLVHKQHYAIDDVAKKVGCEIINVTEGSLINAYKKQQFEDVINKLKE